MGIQHAVKIKMNASFNEANVFKILDTGLEIGFIYNDFIYSDDLTLKSKVLSLDEATTRILMPCNESFKDYGRILVVRHYDVFFHMFFDTLKNNVLEIEIGAFGDNWKNTFYASGLENHNVKYQRFIKTALDLCKDFCIQKLETEAF